MKRTFNTGDLVWINLQLSIGLGTVWTQGTIIEVSLRDSTAAYRVAFKTQPEHFHDWAWFSARQIRNDDEHAAQLLTT